MRHAPPHRFSTRTAPPWACSRPLALAPQALCRSCAVDLMGGNIFIDKHYTNGTRTIVELPLPEDELELELDCPACFFGRAAADGFGAAAGLAAGVEPCLAAGLAAGLATFWKTTLPKPACAYTKLNNMTGGK